MFAAAILALGLGVVSGADCNINFGEPTEVIQMDNPGSAISQVLEISEAETLWTHDTPVAGNFSKFREGIINNVDVDPFALLKRQQAIFQKYLPEVAGLYGQIVNGEIGTVVPITCIEASLYERHLKLQDDSDIGAEFHAWILRSRENSSRLRIVFTSTGELSVNPPSEYVKSNLPDWEVLMNLHNHPFIFDNPIGDIAGTTIPSGGDIATYKHEREALDLSEGWVTNGFHTIRLDRSDIDRMDAFRAQKNHHLY